MEAEPLAPACELAFAVAREGLEADPAIDPPASMRSFLYVAQLPPRAMSVAQREIEDDPAFRARVAERATEAAVGRAGYLWLTRPEGWEHEFASTPGTPPVVQPSGQPLAQRTSTVPDSGMAATVPVDQQTVEPMAPVAGVDTPTASEVRASIEDELSNLRGLVDRLADEGRMVTTSVADLEHELEERRAEVLRLHAEIERLQGEVARTDYERAESAASVQSLESRQAELESELAAKDHALAEADGELVSLRSTVDGLNERTGSVAALEAERDQLENDNRKLAELLAEANRQRDVMSDRLEVAETARTDLEAELGELSLRSQSAAIELHELSHRRDLRDRADLFDAVTAELTAVEGERDRLAAELERARSGLAAAVAALGAATDTVGHELDVTGRALDDATAAVGDLGTRASEAHGRFATLQDAAIGADADATEHLDAATVATPTHDAESTAPSPTDAALTEPVGVDSTDGGAIGSAEVDVDPAAWLPDADDIENLDDHDDHDGDDSEPEGGTVQAGTESGDSGPGSNETVAIDDMLASYVQPSIDEPLGAAADNGAADAGVIDDVDLDEITSEDPEQQPIDTEVEPEERPVDQSPTTVTTIGVGAERRAIDIPADISADPVAVARLVAATEDVVLVIDGDAAADLGWPNLSVADRRSALVSYLGDLAADTGAAPDAVFDGSRNEGDTLPVSRSVRVRLTAPGTTPVSAISDLVDGYPAEWPVAVVTDDQDLAADVARRGATVLENGQLLDLFT